VFWAHQGLETALFATLLTVASLELMRATPIGHWLGGWLFALAIWTRPEAPLVALAATAAVWLRERSWRSFLAAFSPVLVALAALAVWRLAYFGDLLPNTYYAKPPRGLGRSLNFLYDFFRLTHLWYFVPALAIAFVAVRKREDRELLIPLAVVAAQVFFIIYEGGDKKPNHRFLVPILPLCFYLAARAVASLAGRRQTLAVAGATLVFVAVNLLCRVQPPAGGPSMPALAVAARELRPRLWRSWLSERLRTFEPGYIPGNIHTEIGLWVKRTVPPGSTIAYDQMGQTPYFSGHSYKYIDLYGLTDATVAHLKHRFGTEIVPELADYLESRAPAFILVHMNMKIPLVDHPHQRGESCKLCAFLAKYEDIGAMTDLAGNRLGSALRRKPGA